MRFRRCPHCQVLFTPHRRDQKFHSANCRKSSSKAAKAKAMLAEVEQALADSRAAGEDRPNSRVWSPTSSADRDRSTGPTYPKDVKILRPAETAIGPYLRGRLKLAKPTPANPNWLKQQNTPCPP